MVFDKLQVQLQILTASSTCLQLAALSHARNELATFVNGGLSISAQQQQLCVPNIMTQFQWGYEYNYPLPVLGNAIGQNDDSRHLFLWPSGSNDFAATTITGNNTIIPPCGPFLLEITPGLDIPILWPALPASLDLGPTLAGLRSFLAIQRHDISTLLTYASNVVATCHEASGNVEGGSAVREEMGVLIERWNGGEAIGVEWQEIWGVLDTGVLGEREVKRLVEGYLVLKRREWVLDWIERVHFE
ncbi:hypothetical protein CLAFUW4_14841 [Fulvia fulva]|nr:hypothetical protein CLAFUR0_14834 [Fulvia fulva]WPV23002.1 hypothetical protein CLAFUW4_14841 [Fulvia fulva]WPV37941.1 hypothetical protein CLAFUW7_14842 [Fulvia fulva]